MMSPSAALTAVEEVGATERRSAAPCMPLPREHPVVRGDYMAVVFSGSTEALAELPGEPTALTPFKFGLRDPRLSPAEDFACASAATLPTWPDEALKPVDAVCFVFTDASHPAIVALKRAGAAEGAHFIVLDRVSRTEPIHHLSRRLEQFARSIDVDGTVVMLGYGHQGAKIASQLKDDLGWCASRIVVHDSSVDSLRRAGEDGLHAIGSLEAALTKAAGVIYSPLMRHERLHSAFQTAQRRGVPCFDNSRPASGLQQFHANGPVHLDGAAHRALIVASCTLRTKPHGFPITCRIVREDTRCIHGVRFPHLHGGHCHSLHAMKDEIDLSIAAPGDALASHTYGGLQRAFVSVRDRADLGFFSARDLCARLWPQATRAVFPSEHFLDLGATSLERLLQGHFDCREIVSTMQTPAQRVTLAIAACHYAANKPIIEIGSAFGGSALLMAAATGEDGALIHSIDPETSTRDIMRFAFAREGWLQRLHQIVQTSAAAAHAMSAMRGSVGLVFIDGLHTRAGVLSDFEHYAELLPIGGGLAFHDVAPQLSSVLRVVADRVMTDARFMAKVLVDGLLILERVK